MSGACRDRFRVSLTKLGVSVATLALFHLPLAAWSIFDFLYDDKRQTLIAVCTSLVSTEIVHWAYALVYLGILMRISVDAIAGFAMDRQVRQST